MKILTLGSEGALGTSIRDVFPDAIHTGKYRIDVRDYDSCEKNIKDVDIVINLAAITNVDMCEDDPLLCFGTNYLGAKIVADLCIKYDKELVYISTAGIFSSKNKEYFTDKDKPQPGSNYGISKYLGELASLEHSKSYIIRAGWMFGGGIKDKKFVMKLFNQIKDGCRVFYIVNDKKGTLTYTVDFAKGVKNIIELKKYGVYNQVCEGFTDRLEVAKELVKNLGVNIDIKEVTSDYFIDDYYAMRPSNESLKNSDGVFMRHWKECLKEYCDTTLKGML